MVRLPCCALFMHGPVASHWLCEDAISHRYSVEVVGLDVMMGKSDGDGVAGVAFAGGLKVIGGSTTGVAILGAAVAGLKVVSKSVGGQVGAMAAVGLNVLGKSGVGDGGVGHGVGGQV